MKRKPKPELNAEQQKEIVAWIDQNCATFPEPVRVFLEFHHQYLAAEGNTYQSFNSIYRELRRALGITPSSEKRPSNSSSVLIPPNNQVNNQGGEIDLREKLENELARTTHLTGWHGKLRNCHKKKAKRIKERLAKMSKDPKNSNSNPGTDFESELKILQNTPVEEFLLTEEEEAQSLAEAKAFASNVARGTGPDPRLKSTNETLMPSSLVAFEDELPVELPVVIPEDLANAKVIKEMVEPRVRYDFGISVTRLELEVEKKILLDEHNERHVISASTIEYGPPGYEVTWSALATLTEFVGQFAIPMNRLGTMFSTPIKRFTASSLGRMLHYVAERFVPIYLELGKELVPCEILAGDDTSCRVIEISRYFREIKNEQQNGKTKPPWEKYRTPSLAKASISHCNHLKKERIRRRKDGDRQAKPTPNEKPTLGMLIGQSLPFEFPRRNGDGSKQSINTTVVSGRSIADDPRSLIIFYRSHLGSCGNLFETLLRSRNATTARKVILQGDLSPSNFVTVPELLEKFQIIFAGCSSHARRPFANYEHEDPTNCAHMLHLFLGLAIHENCLDRYGRNYENVSAVRENESRDMWNSILELANDMTDKWSKSTKLGAGVRYIINNFDKLTTYLSDPRIEFTNNLRERMLRTEKLIENSSMFRVTIEGRFVLDVLRTILQTAVAAGVPVHEYLVSVLREDPDEVAKNPGLFTPRAWVAKNTESLS